jgi:hypothetical protein
MHGRGIRVESLALLSKGGRANTLATSNKSDNKRLVFIDRRKDELDSRQMQTLSPP